MTSIHVYILFWFLSYDANYNYVVVISSSLGFKLGLSDFLGIDNKIRHFRVIKLVLEVSQFIESVWKLHEVRHLILVLFLRVDDTFHALLYWLSWSIVDISLWKVVNRDHLLALQSGRLLRAAKTAAQRERTTFFWIE